MNKKMTLFLVFILVLSSMLSLTSCGETPKETTKEYLVTLYFANDDYVQSGDETVSPMVKVEGYKLVSTEGQQYLDLVNVALRTVPADLAGADTFIDDKITVNGVTVAEGIATVDLARSGMNSGSLTESFVISQVVESLLKSFKEVKKVQFLVDGEKAESLMGHYDVRSPFTEGIYQ